MTDQTTRYRKRPLEVEARQLLGSRDGETARAIAEWCGGSLAGTRHNPKLFVPTLEGGLAAQVGDWVVRGIKGEFHPVKPDIFAATYVPADQPQDRHTASSITDPDLDALYDENDRITTVLREILDDFNRWRATPPDPEVRQVLVHPAVWPHLNAWLESRGLILARIPDIEDDLPTYAMVLAVPNTPEPSR